MNAISSLVKPGCGLIGVQGGMALLDSIVDNWDTASNGFVAERLRRVRVRLQQALCDAKQASRICVFLESCVEAVGRAWSLLITVPGDVFDRGIEIEQIVIDLEIGSGEKTGYPFFPDASTCISVNGGERLADRDEIEAAQESNGEMWIDLNAGSGRLSNNLIGSLQTLTVAVTHLLENEKIWESESWANWLAIATLAAHRVRAEFISYWFRLRFKLP